MRRCSGQPHHYSKPTPKREAQRDTLVHWAGEHHPDNPPVVPRTVLVQCRASPEHDALFTLQSQSPRGMSAVTMPGRSRRVTIPVVPPKQPRHFLTAPACPQQGLGWSRPQSCCHDHHICHVKPGLHRTELLQVHGTSQWYQFDGSTRRLFSS